MIFQLRWYQEEAVQSIYNYFMSKTGNPVVALPTASGKSLIPAVFIQRAMHIWPNQKFLLITHIKELIKQNADKLLAIWPEAPLGIHSAGLKQRDYALPIIFGGIQSMIKNPMGFGHRDIIFIDEAHLISADESSMYLRLIAMMKLINPNLKVVGFSATPFRMGMGYITENGLFTDICYDMTDILGFNKLIKEGYLCPLIPKRTRTEIDVSNVGIAKGEFIASQLEKTVDRAEITYSALQELIHYGHDRKAWLIFASGIEHSNHISEQLAAFGVNCASVHSKQKSNYNDEAIKAFLNGELQAISNFGKLTTGFDNPIIDLIADLRPTLSVPLHIQKYGRGMRISEGKKDCLCLDFAKNTVRLGCVNEPIIPRKKGEKEGSAPVKICEACGTYNYASARVCINCGQEFEFKVKIVPKAGTEELLRSDAPVIEQYDVVHAIYTRGQKTDKITKEIMGKPYIKCTYFVGGQSFNEFVFPEGAGPMRHRFKEWWKQRHTTEPPLTTDEALKHTAALRCPRKVKVRVNMKYPEVLGVEY